jgi:hypothetical protein
MNLNCGANHLVSDSFIFFWYRFKYLGQFSLPTS